jgi:glucose/arabinose dehydrogenase
MANTKHWGRVACLAFTAATALGCGDAEKRHEQTDSQGIAAVTGGFVDELIASGISQPTAMAFTPDGRLFVAQQNGLLRVVTTRPRALLSAPFSTVTTNGSGEQGLLGVAIDPDFETNGHVYVYYTATTPNVHNRVSRFTASATNPNVAQAGSETVLLELDNPGTGNHNGGAIHFSPSGKLFIAVGDRGNSANAQALTTVSGKMLRINADGSIPTDNPFYAETTGKNRAIWARGLRNPFRFGIHPGSGRMLINDVGAGGWEEINLGARGANYGWPMTEGPIVPPQPGLRGPLFAYPHSVGSAITAGAFYSPSKVRFPSAFVGRYFFSDHYRDWIRVLDPDNGTVSDFATGLVNPVDFAVKSDGTFWYLQRGGSPAGQLRRVRYTIDEPPMIDADPTNAGAAVGSPVSFRVLAVGTSPLAYQWKRNGADIPGATGAVLSFTATLADNGANYRCVVTNAFGTATTTNASLSVGPIAEGSYTLHPMHLPQGSNPQCVVVDPPNTNYADVVQRSCVAPQARWQFLYRDAGYEIRSASNGWCMALMNAPGGNGTDVVAGPICFSMTSARWQARAVSGAAGVYEFTALSEPNRCLNVFQAGTLPGTNVDHRACAGAAHQRFQLVP